MTRARLTTFWGAISETNAHHNAITGNFATTDGNEVRKFSPNDVFPDTQSNIIPRPVSLGSSAACSRRASLPAPRGHTVAGDSVPVDPAAPASVLERDEDDR